jgi:hypothetical protein
MPIFNITFSVHLNDFQNCKICTWFKGSNNNLNHVIIKREYVVYNKFFQLKNVILTKVITNDTFQLQKLIAKNNFCIILTRKILAIGKLILFT